MDVPYHNSLHFVGALNTSARRSRPKDNSTCAMLSSVRHLTIRDDYWRALTTFCSNLQSVTIRQPSFSPPFRIAVSYLETLGGNMSHLRKLHCGDRCEQLFINGAFPILTIYYLSNCAAACTRHLPQIEELGFFSGYPRGSSNESILVCE